MNIKNNKFKTFFKSSLGGIFPAVIMLFILSAWGLWSGKISIVTLDMGQQYTKFYQLYQNTFHGDWSNLLINWQNGFGIDMVGIWTYYLMSPINLILLFFDAKHIAIAVIIMLIIKIFLSGWMISFYLNHKGLKRRSWSIALSTAYALSGWVLAYQFNLPWLDVMWLLPLILYGLDRLLIQKKIGVYLFSLLVLIIDNYYMGYMVCGFTLLYVFNFFAEQQWSYKKHLKDLARYFYVSLLSGGLSAILLVPTITQLQESKQSYHDHVDLFHLLQTPWEFLFKANSGSLSIHQMPNGSANFFVGSIVIILATVFYTQKQIPKRIRWSNFAVLFLLMLSISVSGLSLIWHAFSEPVWYPARFSFLLSFWLIYTAFMAIKYKFIMTKKMAIVFSLGVTVCGLISFFSASHTNYVNALGVCFSFIVGLFAIKCLYDHTPLSLGFVCLLLLIEMSVNYQLILTRFSQTSPVIYEQQYKDIVNHHKIQSFNYRTYDTNYQSMNDGLAYNFNSPSVFTSTLDKDAIQSYVRLGLSASMGVLRYDNGTLFTDTMFGVSFVNTSFDRRAHLANSSTRYDVKELYQDGYSPGSLPIIGTGLNSVNLNDTKHFSNSLDEQEYVFGSITGLGDSINTRSVSLKPTIIKKGTKYILRYHYKGKPGSIAYICQSKVFNQKFNGAGDLDSKYSVKINHKSTRGFEANNVDSVYSTDNKKDNTIEYAMSVKDLKKYNLDLNLRFYDVESIKHQLKKLSDTNKDSIIKDIHAVNLKGSVLVKNTKQILISLGYSHNYEILVDGKPVKYYKYNTDMIVVPTTSGKHTVEVVPHFKGFKLGAVISLISLILSLILLLSSRKKRY